MEKNYTLINRARNSIPWSLLRAQPYFRDIDFTNLEGYNMSPRRLGFEGRSMKRVGRWGMRSALCSYEAEGSSRSSYRAPCSKCSWAG